MFPTVAPRALGQLRSSSPISIKSMMRRCFRFSPPRVRDRWIVACPQLTRLNAGLVQQGAQRVAHRLDDLLVFPLGYPLVKQIEHRLHRRFRIFQRVIAESFVDPIQKRGSVTRMGWLVRGHEPFEIDAPQQNRELGRQIGSFVRRQEISDRMQAGA